LIILLTSTVCPVYASPIDNGIEMISKGIGQYFENQAEKKLDENYGVTFGNASESENLTPAQRLVYMIAVANQNPYEVKWVRDQLASDLVWFSVAVFLISLFIFGLSMLQKHAPVTVSKINKSFIGHEEIYDYSVWLTTIGKLIFFAILAMPIIIEVLDYELNLSSGLTLNAFEFLKVTPAAPHVFYWESQAYGICAPCFLGRIKFIDLYSAHIFKIILLYAIAWLYSDKIAKLLTCWFLSAVFMRPVVLWYSNIAIKDIAHTYPATNSTFGNFVAQYDIAGVASLDMKLVIYASALTAIVALVWPVIMLIFEIIKDYLLGVIYTVVKLCKISGGK
jgi:hypothetical protein